MDVRRPVLNIESFKKRNRIAREIEVKINEEYGFIITKISNDKYIVLEQHFNPKNNYTWGMAFKDYKEVKKYVLSQIKKYKGERK